jgi:hypothetical protein
MTDRITEAWDAPMPYARRARWPTGNAAPQALALAAQRQQA